MEATQVSWIQKLIVEPDRELATATLGAAFLSATAEERAAVVSGWDFGVEWPYPTPARLACTNGEHTSPRERIISSMVLESLEGVIGTREHLISLCATYRLCELAGLSPSEVFESVAASLPDGNAQVLRAFVRRRAKDRTLSAFSLEERVNQDGEIEVHLSW